MAKKPNRSSRTDLQYTRIIQRLRVSPATSEQLRFEGVYCVAPRIMELRKMGYDIETERRQSVDRDGYEHRGVGLYILHSEPPNFPKVRGAA